MHGTTIYVWKGAEVIACHDAFRGSGDRRAQHRQVVLVLNRTMRHCRRLHDLTVYPQCGDDGICLSLGSLELSPAMAANSTFVSSTTLMRRTGIRLRR
jgi:hypothetical protein